MTECAVVLHNIRSVYNVGSIFRTADAAGVSKIFLTGYTPTPLDRFGRARKDFAKVSLGAEQSVAWEYVKNPLSAIKKIKDGGYTVIAVEQDPRAVSLFEWRPDAKNKSKQKIALVFGNEVRGVSKALLHKCDQIVEIPMKGKKESLNVSVAAGVALFVLPRTDPHSAG